MERSHPYTDLSACSDCLAVRPEKKIDVPAYRRFRATQLAYSGQYRCPVGLAEAVELA